MTEVAEKKGVVNFLKETKVEMKKVTWPTKKEVTSSTTVILIILVTFGFAIGFLDVGLQQLVKFLIRIF